MASRRQIDATYNYMDPLFRASLGENPDVTAAMFSGNRSITLADAQHAKHCYILQEIEFQPRFRVLDIGCGWGGFLAEVRRRGGHGVGLTLSSSQAQACLRSGLDVQLLDWKDVDIQKLGTFDSIVSVGAFEHFCSEEEYLAAQQEHIYSRFFQLCWNLLPRAGHLYLQTMTWGAPVPNPANITLDQPRGSDEYLLAVIRKFYPGSWLPSGLEQITTIAEPYFCVRNVRNGREDYVETLTRWGRELSAFRPRKIPAVLLTIPYLFRDRDFLRRLQALAGGYQTQCFKRGLMDHFRVSYQKK